MTIGILVLVEVSHQYS